MADVVERVAQELGSQRARLGIPLDENELRRLADAYGIDVTAFFGGRITPKEYLFGG